MVFVIQQFINTLIKSFYFYNLIYIYLKIISKLMKHAHLFRQDLQTQKCDIFSQSQHQGSNVAIAITNAIIPSDKIQIQKAFQSQKDDNNKFNAEKIKLFYKEDYQPAKYGKSLQYKNLHSYLKKNKFGEYQAIKMMDNTEEFKYFGLGIYFYIQFMRRINWLFLVMTILVTFTIVINWFGENMSYLTPSFSTYLIKSSIGNYSQNKITIIDGYIVTIVPAANFFALFIFYIIWKGHFFKSKKQEEQNTSSIKPQKFTIQISGLNQNFKNENELKKFFSTFGQIYEVSLVYRYSNKLSYFSDLEEIQQNIKQQQLQIILGGGSQKRIQQLKQKKQQLIAKINLFEIQMKTISAFIHFQMENARNQCLTDFNNNYLFDNCSNNCIRNCCCCCIQQPNEKFKFYDSHILIKNDKVPPAYDINWNSYQIGLCEKTLRFIISFIVILIFLALSTTLIGMCSIYITSRSSNCQNIVIPSTLTQAQASTNSMAQQCFCEANLISTISNSDLNSFCGKYVTDIYISQGIQYGIIFTTALINFLFSLLVSSLVNFVRPASKSSKLFSQTLIYTVFIILNSIMVPLLIYANIYGFTASNYVSFLTIISSDIKNFLAIDNISFHSDFNTVWYKNVAVIFINFIILDTILVWILFVADKYLSSHSSLQSQEGKILQKHMNKTIIAYKLNVYKQMAGFYLILVICLLFSSGVPILVPLTFINIFSRYIKNRYMIQNHSSQIEGLGQDYNTLSISILPIILIICPLIGQWMLVANGDIYPNKLSMTFPFLNGHFTHLDKQLYLPFYILIALLAFCQFFVYNIFVRFISCLCSLCYQGRDLSLSYNARPFSQYVKRINILSSYNIRNNDEMKNIILTLQKYFIEQKGK